MQVVNADVAQAMWEENCAGLGKKCYGAECRKCKTKEIVLCECQKNIFFKELTYYSMVNWRETRGFALKEELTSLEAKKTKLLAELEKYEIGPIRPTLQAVARPDVYDRPAMACGPWPHQTLESRTAK